MIVLIIPDVHLKPYMFTRAAELMRSGIAETAICLMDIADDWHQQFNIDLYIYTYDAAIAFAKEFPETLWCYGNHDLSYEWQKKESGYSIIAPHTVCTKLHELRESLPDISQISFIHKIDNVLFMHGGLTHDFVYNFVPHNMYSDEGAVIEQINLYDSWPMWQDLSPLWYRPQYGSLKMYKPRKLLQVVGHTPVREINRKENVLSCDVFSLSPSRQPSGSQEFTLLETKTWEWKGIR